MVRRVLSVILAASLVFGCAASDHPENPALLIIDAIASPTHQRQPTYLAIKCQGRVLTHIRTGGALVELPATNCRIVHVDFEQQWAGPNGTVYFRQPRPEFHLQAGAIGYFGTIRVKKDLHSPTLDVIGDVELLRRVCSTNPLAFSKFPVYVINDTSNEELGYVDCHSPELRVDR